MENHEAYKVNLFANGTALRVKFLNHNITYVYSHFLHIANETNFLLPPRPSLVNEFADRIVKVHGGRFTVLSSSKNREKQIP